jgi:hypothetical protein
VYGEELPELSDKQRQALIEGSVGGGISVPTSEEDADADGDKEETANTVKAKITFGSDGEGTIEKVKSQRANSKRAKKLKHFQKETPKVSAIGESKTEEEHIEDAPEIVPGSITAGGKPISDKDFARKLTRKAPKKKKDVQVEMTGIGSIGMNLGGPQGDPYKGRESNWEPSKSKKSGKKNKASTANFITQAFKGLK